MQRELAAEDFLPDADFQSGVARLRRLNGPHFGSTRIVVVHEGYAAISRLGVESLLETIATHFAVEYRDLRRRIEALERQGVLECRRATDASAILLGRTHTQDHCDGLGERPAALLLRLRCVLGEEFFEFEPGDDVRIGSVAVLVAAILDAAGA